MLSGTPLTRRLCEEISSISGGVCILGMSRGKDSLAAWVWLEQFFTRIIPFHSAMVPHLRIADESLAHYEKQFGTKIERALHGSFPWALYNLVYQPIWDDDEIEAMKLKTWTNSDIAQILREKYNVPQAWAAYGINMVDSLSRRVRIKAKGIEDGGAKHVAGKTFYPCFDWTREMILEAIRYRGLSLPRDYLVTNRTLAEIPSCKEIELLEEVCPEDFKRLEAAYPLMRAMLCRNEFRKMKLASKAKA